MDYTGLFLGSDSNTSILPLLDLVVVGSLCSPILLISKFDFCRVKVMAKNIGVLGRCGCRLWGTCLRLFF